jgi:transposase
MQWASALPERTWALKGACGLGHMLARHPAAAGEQVLDIQPKSAARVRLLASDDTNKNDPNDTRLVAIAALRSAACREVRLDDHAAVLKVWSKRHRDLGRLHAVLCELDSPGFVEASLLGQPPARAGFERRRRLRPGRGARPPDGSR